MRFVTGQSGANSPARGRLIPQGNLDFFEDGGNSDGKRRQVSVHAHLQHQNQIRLASKFVRDPIDQRRVRRLGDRARNRRNKGL